MGYSTDESMVRVDFFKDWGKWYCTEAVQWTGYDRSNLINVAFATSLIKHLRQKDHSIRLYEMTAVCIEPYHEHAHPLMMTVREAFGIVEGRRAKS